MAEKKYVIAFDFEAAGGVTPKNGFTQLGAALICVDDQQVIATFNEYANMSLHDWEDRCVREFWSKNPKRFEETKIAVRNAQNDPFDVVAMFLDWVQANTHDKKDVVLITDNAAFDAGILRCFSKDRDIMYVFGEYRSIIDVSCVYRGMSRQVVDTALLDESSIGLGIKAVNAVRAGNNEDTFDAFPKFPVEHDHHPVNDAKVMGLKWAFLMNNLK
jgi:hypothetical protein